MQQNAAGIRGVITANPEWDNPVGGVLHFKPMRFAAIENLGHEAIGEPGIFRGTVLAVCFPNKRFNNLLGSAIMVAPGIAFTAAHVLQDCLDDVQAGRMGAWCVGVNGESVEFWRIRHVSLPQAENSDLAVLSLERFSAVPEDRTLHFATLSTRTPAIGETLKVFGIRQLNDYEAVEALDRKVEISLLMSTGNVVQHFPNGRGRGLGPCLELSCHTAGGMSGGPVFDQHGALVGVLSKGLDGGPSLVSSLWPALVWKVKDGWPFGVMRGERSLLELAQNLIAIEGRDAVQLIFEEPGRMAYREW